MSDAIITFKIMPESPDIDLEKVKSEAMAIAKKHGSIGDMRTEEEPIAFGLKAVMVLAMYEIEGKKFDDIADEIKTIEGVQSAEVYKMDLAMG
tara:strand:+ start:2445 stop:2723 length:279 start_codon:yes stop_codon:yes gene_type:complete